MPGILKKVMTLITGDPMVIAQSSRPLKNLTERDLIQLESEIGRELFGPIPDGHRREFFNLDAQTWVWHEEWIDAETGKMRVLTTRYETHPNGILKVQDGQPYKFVEGQELVHLTTAIRMYYERVAREVYYRDPATGQKITQDAGTIDLYS